MKKTPKGRLPTPRAAQHVKSKADLGLPAKVVSQLKEISGHVKQRSRAFSRALNPAKGLIVLFSGPSGTGKIKAAEVIANELRLDLYRIDLSAAVGKYMGETEKNLNRLFDTTQASKTILFLDEGDALFGKRSEVKDAHDRYANIEVGYLLERMEDYDGMVILATNLKTNIDPAFVRRLRFIIEFPRPSVEDRRDLWGNRDTPAPKKRPPRKA